MEVLERIWEIVSAFFSGLLKFVERSITSLVGSSNARHIKNFGKKVTAINELEDKYKAMSDEELREQTTLFRKRLAAGETLDDILVEAFAVCREGGRRFLNMRHYDVQLIGGMVLHSGSIAEMVTGEGKTLVATLPCYLNALEGKGVHVVTVNDYLARRDMEWMAPLYMGLGLTVDAIQSDMEVKNRQKAYSCDITYGTNNEYGFDYLRDNMRPARRGDDRRPSEQQQSQGPLHFAIIDEVDNILIDEARTPLIISGPVNSNAAKYGEADKIVRRLQEGKHFEVKEKEHTVHLTDEGVREAERLAGVESFYTAGNMEWPHLIDNALKAHYLHKKDVNYMVRGADIVIIDEFTGRAMEGRQWSDGLHQAVEAKEGVKIKDETQTLATITLQNFFKLYNKICGMTGTAMTEANEFWKIYKLDVVAIPTNKIMERIEHPDVIYCTEKEKYEAVADEINQISRWDVVLKNNGEEVWGTLLKENENEVSIRPEGNAKKEQVIPQSEIRTIQYKGRPILVGTVSVEKSERISRLLEKRGVKHEILNAKQHKREADVVAQAGRRGAVTIATNMAGRGTDIVLGGNPETMAWAQLQYQYETRLDVPHNEWEALVSKIEAEQNMKEEGAAIKNLGGLHVIGTERHESRRIDLQLRGRCGRQGDPGSSRFFLSLEDDLMRIFAGAWVKSILERLGMKEGEAIESRMVTRRIEGAQKKVEERNFETRKNLLEYDEVMDEQRKRVYRFRQDILEDADCKEMILEMIQGQVDDRLDLFLDTEYGAKTFARWASLEMRLSVPLEPRLFKRVQFEEAQRLVMDQAERNAESDIAQAIEENLPEDGEQSDWNWGALARFANFRFGSNLRDRDLKSVGRDEVDVKLIEIAHKAIQKTDLSEGKNALNENYGLKSLVEWASHKFGIDLEVEQIEGIPKEQLATEIMEKIREAYRDREMNYPVMAGLYRYTNPGEGGQTRLDRDALIRWAANRFETTLGYEDIKNKQRDEIRTLLVECSKSHLKDLGEYTDLAHEKVDEVYEGQDHQTLLVNFYSPQQQESLVQWLQDNTKKTTSVEEFQDCKYDDLKRLLVIAVWERYRPEIYRMERAVLLQLVDSAWKDHLLAMDHLRDHIGFVGYAQLDAKVEYKRDGMRLFEEMWQSVGDRVAELVFRMEQLDEDFVASTWVETEAVHEQLDNQTSEIAQQQQAAINSSQGSGEERRVEPIRNKEERVGRNDPCPCGSGKKYKVCCRKNAV